MYCVALLANVGLISSIKVHFYPCYIDNSAFPTMRETETFNPNRAYTLSLLKFNQPKSKTKQIQTTQKTRKKTYTNSQVHNSLMIHQSPLLVLCSLSHGNHYIFSFGLSSLQPKTLFFPTQFKVPLPHKTHHQFKPQKALCPIH